MTNHIRRFVDQEGQGYSESFAELYGNTEFRETLRKVSAPDRADTMVGLYGDELKKRGGFRHVVYTPVFQPKSNAIHFHLIYASRHLKGLTVFKDEEKKAVEGMEQKRAIAQQRKRESGGELELFGSMELHDNSFYNALRDRYLRKLLDTFKSVISANRRTPYDDLLGKALEIPLVWESDLKKLLLEQKDLEIIAYEGIEARQKVPRSGANNIIVRLS